MAHSVDLVDWDQLSMIPLSCLGLKTRVRASVLQLLQRTNYKVLRTSVKHNFILGGSAETVAW